VLLPPTFDANSFFPGPKPARLLERYGLRVDQPVILTVARLAGAERYKGYDQILEALPVVQRRFPDVRYVLVGQGDDRARIDARIRELGLGDAVTMAGFVSDAELRDHYNLCDVFAMPSKREGFGIVYVESAACGKPALGGNQDGAVDALNGGRFGVLVDPDNVGDIASALNDLLARQYPTPLLYHPEQLRTAVIEQFGIDRFRELLQSYLWSVPGRATAHPA
jgi:glycosyltransferase involved in cell wall biosynthesis